MEIKKEFIMTNSTGKTIKITINKALSYAEENGLTTRELFDYLNNFENKKIVFPGFSLSCEIKTCI